jgi:galactokinase
VSSSTPGSRAATASAPGRVNLIGEHTDYNDGFALPMALDRRCRATVTVDGGDRVTVASAQHPTPASVPVADIRPGGAWIDGEDGWAAYAVGVAWALVAEGHLPSLPGMAIELDSDVPLGSGLSSSAAVGCSVGLALDRALGLGLPRTELVTVTRRAENDVVGAPTGGMDQLASLLCTADHALLCDLRAMTVDQVPFDPAAAGLAVVMLDSRVRHRNADGGYAARRAACEQAAADLGVPALRDVTVDDLPAALARLGSDELRRRTRHVVTEDARVLETAELLRTGRVRDIGALLTASHHSMRDDFEITTPEIDAAVEAALQAGALGARMTGGGFGGYVLALVDGRLVDSVADAVARRFAGEGFETPTSFVAQPAAGAE